MLHTLFLLLLLHSADNTAAGADKEVVSVTHHEIVANGHKLVYTVTTGRMQLKTEEGAARAAIFYMAYTLDHGESMASRPLTFSFNGGPGSSSVWLHLGLLGPKQVAMDEQGNPLAPPYRLVDNNFTMLDKTDLVFIDPVGTGYSRAAKGVKPAEFHGVEEDIESVGEFIRLYTSKNKRWPSPKFMIGESYGTTRAAGLVNHLQERDGMYFNGVMLISSILNFQTARFDDGNDMPYLLFLPTYTATAFYHGRLDPALLENLETTLEQAKAFALGEYATALLKGDLLEEAEADEIATKLARFTGLSKEFVKQSNLRIYIHRFTKELLRDQRQTVGRLDSRFKGIDRDASGASFEYDPSYAAIQGPYSSVMNQYLQGDLDYQSELPYEILTGRVQPWSYNNYTNRYVDVSEALREAMTHNQNLKVFVANGYYDLATPFFATEYTFNHMQLDPSLKSNITMTYFASGHMMYIQQTSLEKLKADLDTFYIETLTRKGP